MPAFNEGPCIYQNALEAAKQAASFADEYEILVVDDGSGDDTFQQATLAGQADRSIRCVRMEENMGKGCALRRGTELATGDYICFCDADLDVHPSQLDRFIDVMLKTGADAVIGTKWNKESKLDYPFVRKVLSLGYFIVIKLLFHLRCRDTQTGLKLFKAGVIKTVMQRVLVKRFAFDIEVLAIIQLLGYRIESAPVNIIFQKDGFGRINLKEIYSMFVDTLAIFYRLRILHYYDKAHFS